MEAYILENITSNIPSLIKLANGIFYLMGMLFIIQAVFYIKKVEEKGSPNSQSKLKLFLTKLFFGVMLLNIPQLLEIVNFTLWNNPAIYAYEITKISRYAAFIKLCFLAMKLFGMASFVNGLLIIKENRSPKFVNGGSANARGLKYIVGGIFAINFIYFYETVCATLGFPSLLLI